MQNRPLTTGAFILATALAATVLAPAATAQCSPFSKSGMRPIHWRAGSSLTLGSTDSGDAAIALRFAHDEEHDVRLEEITHRGTRPDGTVALYPFSTLPPTGASTALWRAVFRPVDSQDPIEVTPADASWFIVWVNDRRNPTAVTFQWLGVDLPDPLADSFFWMELHAEIDCDDPARVEWDSRLGRAQLPRNPNHYTLDEVEAPILHLRAPGNGLMSRLLVPVAAATAIPAENLPLPIWSVFGDGFAFEHPARNQQMQWSAVYDGNPASSPLGDDVLSSYRKLLYLATEDAEGHYKRFLHRVVLDPVTGAYFYRWAPVHFPTYGVTPYLNYHQSPYPVVFQAIEAQSDSFWYDCTETYREFVDREMGLTRIADPNYPLNPDFPRASPFIANSVVEPFATDLPTISSVAEVFPQYTDNALRMQAVFDGADGRTLPTFMEWQKWLNGASPVDWPFGPREPEDPVGPGFNPRPYTGAPDALLEPPPFVIQEIERAQLAGINTSVYTGPLAINRDDWPSFDTDWLLRRRDGSLIPVGPLATGNIIDYGANGAAHWMATVLYDNIFDTIPELGGVFFDVLSGGGSFLRYPEAPSQLFGLDRYHGGTAYVEGTQRLFDMVRARIAAGKPTNVHPDIPFLPAETVQEYLAGRVDFAQQGLKAPPMQMQLNTLFDAIVGAPVLSLEASNPSPPLWNAVYHEWARAEGLTVMLSGLGVNEGFGGGQPGGAGLTWPLWGNYMRFVHALWWFQGMKPTSFQYLTGYEHLNLLTDAPGGGVAIREFRGAGQPTQPPQPEQLITFLRRMHHALDRFEEAGKFLNTGRMERPLATQFTAQTGLPGPSATVAAAVPASVPGVRHFYENFFSTQPYSVPYVFHAVWRSVETGELGIVFVNWSDAPAQWQGELDPALYDGFENGFTLHGVAPDGAGVTEYVMGAGTGATTLSWSAGSPGIALRHHDAVAPGPMPPRSIQVIVVRPQ